MDLVVEMVAEPSPSHNIHSIPAQQQEARWTSYGNGEIDWKENEQPEKQTQGEQAYIPEVLFQVCWWDHSTK